MHRVIDYRSKTYWNAPGVAMSKDGPSLEFGNLPAIHINKDPMSLYDSSSCLYKENFCSNGYSFSLWLKVVSLSNKVSFYLTGGRRNQGFSILSPVVTGSIFSTVLFDVCPSSFTDMLLKGLAFTWCNAPEGPCSHVVQCF